MKMIKNINKTEMKAVSLYLAKKYFAFLFKNNRDEVLSLAENASFYAGERMNLREFSKLMQRKLYRIARENGFKKNKQNKFKWEKGV